MLQQQSTTKLIKHSLMKTIPFSNEENSFMLAMKIGIVLSFLRWCFLTFSLLFQGITGRPGEPGVKGNRVSEWLHACVCVQLHACCTSYSHNGSTLSPSLHLLIFPFFYLPCPLFLFLLFSLSLTLTFLCDLTIGSKWSTRPQGRQRNYWYQGGRMLLQYVSTSMLIIDFIMIIID